MNPPVLHTLIRSDGYATCVVECTSCRHAWVRNVRDDLVVSRDPAPWLCPRGWGNECPHGGFFQVVDRPEVLAAHLLADVYGFGDAKGCPPRRAVT